MIVAVEGLLSLLFVGIGYYIVCYYLNDKKIFSKSFNVLKLEKNKVLYLILSAVICVTVITVFQLAHDLTFIEQIKLLLLVWILLPIAAVDYKIQKIPNKFLLAAIILRFVLLIAEFIISVDAGLEIFKDNIIGGTVIGIFFLLLLLVFKNSIGMGDVKLFAVMGLYQGLWGTTYSVFCSLTVSFIISILLLLTKKKNRKDTISFGPSILGGTVISICLTGM